MHDTNGQSLKVGDKVLVPCEVERLTEGVNGRGYACLVTTLGASGSQRQAIPEIATDVLLKVADAGKTLGL